MNPNEWIIAKLAHCAHPARANKLQKQFVPYLEQQLYLIISEYQREICDKDSYLHIDTHFCIVFYTEPQWMNNCKAHELCTPCPCKQIVKIVWTISGVVVVLNYFSMPGWNLYWALDLNLDESIDTAFLHSFPPMNPNEWMIAKLANCAHPALAKKLQK